MRCHGNRFLSLAGLVVIFAAGLVAGPPPLIVTDSGYYLTIIDQDGLPTLEKIATVVDLRTGSEPPITPETPKPEPPAAPPEGISSDVAGWAAEVGNPIAAQKYALVFETVRDGVLDGKVTSATLYPILRQSADLILDSDWDVFRRKLGDYLVEQSQAGKMATTAQIHDTLEAVRYGIAYSATDAKKLSGGDALAVVSKVSSIIDGAGQ